MILELELPENFDFTKTIGMIRRGCEDPINIVNNNQWGRVFKLKENCLIIARENKNNGLVDINSINSGKPEDIVNIVKYSLGLNEFDIVNEIWGSLDQSKAEKIAHAHGLAIPGYPCLFEAIVQIIVGQQVSVIVANKVRAKITHALGRKYQHDNQEYFSFPTPQDILVSGIELLLTLGLSKTKAKAIFEVAQHFENNREIYELNLNFDVDANEIRQRLIKLYGVGNWTIDWLLLRHFRCFEFIPETDLAVRKAFTWWFGRDALMSFKDVKRYEQEYYPHGGVFAFLVLYAYANNKTFYQ